MCGIAGYLNRSQLPASTIILKRMTDAIIHRGPDGEGHWAEGEVALGHRRLAIIDLTPAGNQPMISADNRYVISYNGEVYNYQELRIELEAEGYQFHSRTDTEVVLNAFVQWGVSSLDRLNGMFAFAIWDRKEKKLFLARDRYGIKPLYYTVAKGNFLFASEVKSFLQHPDYQVSVDKAGLIEYFTFQNFFTDRTLFDDVKLLPAGSYMFIDPANINSPNSIRYWDYSFEEPNQVKDKQSYLEELDRLMVQAVNRQMVSDVEVGSYLSGGMDSGTITALAAKNTPYIRTFTTGFDLRSASGIELGFDERENAEFMSYLFKTEHYEMVLKAGDMERILPKLSWHLEEPRVGQSYPNFYTAQLASKFCRVVLSGDAGDELFGGYPWRYYRAVVNDDFDHYVEKYYSYWQRLIPTHLMSDVFSPIWNTVKDVSTKDIFKDVFVEHASQFTRPEDYVNHSLYFEANTFMHSLLIVEDKLSMAHSLETRVPFLDNDLVDFSMKVPANLKLGNLTEVVSLNENEPGPKMAKYFQKTRDGKLLLREAMEKYIPKDVTQREKQGFSAPDASWFRGESIAFVKNRLMRKDAKIFDFMDRKTIHHLVDEHLSGNVNRRLLIWSLLNMEEWIDGYLDNSARIGV